MSHHTQLLLTTLKPWKPQIKVTFAFGPSLSGLHKAAVLLCCVVLMVGGGTDSSLVTCPGWSGLWVSACVASLGVHRLICYLNIFKHLFSYV